MFMSESKCQIQYQGFASETEHMSKFAIQAVRESICYLRLIPRPNFQYVELILNNASSGQVIITLFNFRLGDMPV